MILTILSSEIVKGSKVAMDITPRNLKNLIKRLKMDDFTGG